MSDELQTAVRSCSPPPYAQKPGRSAFQVQSVRQGFPATFPPAVPPARPRHREPVQMCCLPKGLQTIRGTAEAQVHGIELRIERRREALQVRRVREGLQKVIDATAAPELALHRKAAQVLALRPPLPVLVGFRAAPLRPGSREADEVRGLREAL